MKKTVFIFIISLTFSILSFLMFVWFTTEHYSMHELAQFDCKNHAKPLDLSHPIKVMTWNIQFLAGKNYIFFYDAIDGSGTDEAPSQKDTEIIFQEVTRILHDENPDFVLLQEVDVDAKRTYFQNQAQMLYKSLSSQFPCMTSTYYWRAGFVPHPHILGSVGMKLVTLSRYLIEKSERHSLGEFPSDILSRQFRPKRAILESTIATTEGPSFHLLNTHLEAYSQGSDLMQQQVHISSQQLQRLEIQGRPWIFGGDFNLLMPGQSYFQLSHSQRSLYQEKSELQMLTHQFPVLPQPHEVNGLSPAQWYTHFPNDPEVNGPDRTIDYLFHSPRFQTLKHYVRFQDTIKISDHLPLIGIFHLKKINP